MQVIWCILAEYTCWVGLRVARSSRCIGFGYRRSRSQGSRSRLVVRTSRCGRDNRCSNHRSDTGSFFFPQTGSLLCKMLLLCLSFTIPRWIAGTIDQRVMPNEATINAVLVSVARIHAFVRRWTAVRSTGRQPTAKKRAWTPVDADNRGNSKGSNFIINIIYAQLI